jgi:hypothetical protein
MRSNEECSRVACELQVRDRLREMDWEHAFDRFHLHYDAFFHEQVYFQAALESMAFVLDRDVAFTLEAEVCLQQLEDQALRERIAFRPPASIISRRV